MLQFFASLSQPDTRPYEYTTEDIPELPQELIFQGAPAAWDEEVIFCSIKYPFNNDPTDGFLIYGGNSQTEDRSSGSLGAFDLITAISGTKDAANPIVDKADLGLTDPFQGVFPMSIWVEGSTVYLFCSYREGSFEAEAYYQIAYLTAPISDPKNFNDTLTILDLDNGSSLGRWDHSCHIDTDPTDSDFLLMFYGNRPNSSSDVVTNVARALKSNIASPTAWTIIHTDIIGATIPSAGILYPFWWFESGLYRVFYSRFQPSVGLFAVYYTQSSDLSSFPEGEIAITPTELAGDFDGSYTSMPRKYGDFVYYSGRPLSGTGQPYIGVGVKKLVKVFI